MTNCTFTNNSADNSGGGMYNYVSVATLRNCTFTNNSAEYAGGGMANEDSSPTLTDCTFTNNSADQYAGGMVNQDSSTTLTNCTFESNTAGQNGGGMYNTGSDPTLTDCRFANNSAQVFTGGMINFSSSPILTNCSLEGNSASQLYHGGGMYNVDSSDPTLTDTNVCGNTYDQMAGDLTDQIAGAWTDNGGNCISEICDSDQDGTLDCFDNCPNDPDKTEPGECGCDGPETGDSDGDGIADCNDPCPNWPYDCSEDGTTITVALGQSIQEAIDAAPAGGTVQIAAGSFAVTSTINPLGKPVTIRGAVDANNDPTTIIDGGGSHTAIICTTSEGSDTVFENLVIQNGSSATVSGGMFIYQSAPTISNCVFSNNMSNGDGGGMLIIESPGPNIENCLFTNNTTQLKGGGLALFFSNNVNLTNCVFDDNEAAGNAGAVMIFNSNANMDGCTVTNNEAMADASAIRIAATSNLVLTNTTVCDNNGPNPINGVFTDGGENCISAICDSDQDGTPDGCDPCPNWPGECDDDGGTLIVAPGESIQSAIDLVPVGGSVQLEAGTYVLSGTLDPGGKAFTLSG
ncbi:MAG: hypothetical protein GY894_05185, partial [Planctomycetes bacterium]|nr:hypothetical protein [Planctomycetota bacterium]